MATVDKMVFVKEHRTGLCFGVASSKFKGFIDDSGGMNVTTVPCDAVKHHLINTQ